MARVSKADKFKALKNPTVKQCIQAVKSCGLLLEFIDNQTEEICLEAVKQDGNALEFVKNKNNKIIKEALKQNGFAIIHCDFFEDALKKYDDANLLVKESIKKVSNKALINKTISEIKE